jgi:multidrug efflux system outer membrane protein
MRPIFILLLMLLPSCMLGPEPASPAGGAPSGIRGDSQPSGSSFGDRAWRQVFTDSTLRALIERALANNPDLVAASFRIEEARALSGVSRADRFPALEGSLAGLRDVASKNSGQARTERASSAFAATALLSWEADLWGGIRRSDQAARARWLEAEFRRDAVRTSLVAAVAGAYIELKNLDERLAISQRTVTSRRSSLELVSAQRDGGVSSDLEVGQAEALLGQALVSIPLTERAIAAKENEIRVLLGDFPGPVARGGDLEALARSLKIAGGLPSSLLARRPDLAAADQAFQAATAEIGVAEALRLPRLALTSRGGLASSELGNLLQAGSGTFSLGPSLAGPIFDAGRSGFRVKAAQARARQALAAHEQAAKAAFREAADAIHGHLKSGEIIEERLKLVEALKKVSLVAQDRFQAGASSYLEVLDAERSLFLAELDLADAQSERLLATVLAYRALGGGWQ